jgi:hypothetical protein
VFAVEKTAEEGDVELGLCSSQHLLLEDSASSTAIVIPVLLLLFSPCRLLQLVVSEQQQTLKNLNAYLLKVILKNYKQYLIIRHSQPSVPFPMILLRRHPLSRILSLTSNRQLPPPPPISLGEICRGSRPPAIIAAENSKVCVSTLANVFFVVVIDPSTMADGAADGDEGNGGGEEEVVELVLVLLIICCSAVVCSNDDEELLSSTNSCLGTLFGHKVMVGVADAAAAALALVESLKQ